MKRMIPLSTIALLCLVGVALGFPRYIREDSIYPPAPREYLNRNPRWAGWLNRRPTPTPTPSVFGSVSSSPLSLPSSSPLVRPTPTKQHFAGMIDLAPNLPEQEKVLLVFRNDKGELIGYWVAPDELRAQRAKLLEEMGPNSLQHVLYPSDRHVQ
jgi:hypothetical protein